MNTTIWKRSIRTKGILSVIKKNNNPSHTPKSLTNHFTQSSNYSIINKSSSIRGIILREPTRNKKVQFLQNQKLSYSSTIEQEPLDNTSSLVKYRADLWSQRKREYDAHLKSKFQNKVIQNLNLTLEYHIKNQPKSDSDVSDNVGFEQNESTFEYVHRREDFQELTIEVTLLDIAKKFLPRSVCRELIVGQVWIQDKETKDVLLEKMNFDLNGLVLEYIDSFNEFDPTKHELGTSLLTFDDSLEGKEVFWHSSAHLLGWALENEIIKMESNENRNVKLQLCDGPALVQKEQHSVKGKTPISGGFFYEAFINSKQVSLNSKSEVQGEPLSSQSLKSLEKNTKRIMNFNHKFDKMIVDRAFAQKMFKYNPFKLEMLQNIKNDDQITLYKCGDFIDLCKGPHIPFSGLIKAFQIQKTSGAYWNMKKSPQLFETIFEHNQLQSGERSIPHDSNIVLQRIYGISFPSQKQMDNYKNKVAEAEKRDHRTIGKQQELFVFHEYSPGAPFFLPHGVRIFNKLVEFMRKEMEKRNYQEVMSPQIFNKELWETSGHWVHYKDDMFTVNLNNTGMTKDATIGLKPMNCPPHCLVFNAKAKSYKELPVRYCEFGSLHRNELAGALTGLTRVRRFHQDDAHIFCSQDQIVKEISDLLDFVQYVYSLFGFKISLKFSTRPDSYVGTIDMWNRAEDSLRDCLEIFKREKNIDWELNEGDGAFYGPKIDISIEDSLERQHQCATIQLDFQLPQRFNLKYQTKDDTWETPVIIHRAILGSLERFIALLTEHVNGKWAFWLSPRQCIVLPVSNKFDSYAEKVYNQLKEEGYYVDLNLSSNTINKKVLESQKMRYNYALVVGAQEQEDNSVNIRKLDGEKLGTKSLDELSRMFKELKSSFQ